MVCFCDKMIRCFGGFASENNKAATVEESVAALLPIQHAPARRYIQYTPGREKNNRILYVFYHTALI